jgi:hypothetical protein
LTSPAKESEIAIIRMAQLAFNIYYYVRPLQVHNKTKHQNLTNVFQALKTCLNVFKAKPECQDEEVIESQEFKFSMQEELANTIDQFSKLKAF